MRQIERLRVWGRTRRGLTVLVLALAAATAVRAQGKANPLPHGAIVELRYAGPRDVPLVRANGDTVVARGLRTVMGTVLADRGDTLVLTSLFGRTPADDQFRALTRSTMARLARADAERVIVIDGKSRARRVGTVLVVAAMSVYGIVCLVAVAKGFPET